MDPTPEQIAAKCAEIQSRWSDAERERRVALPKPQPVIAQVVAERELGLSDALESLAG